MNRTLYVRPDDEPVWAHAAMIAEADDKSVSQVFARLLREYVEQATP